MDSVLEMGRRSSGWDLDHGILTMAGDGSPHEREVHIPMPPPGEGRDDAEPTEPGAIAASGRLIHAGVDLSGAPPRATIRGTSTGYTVGDEKNSPPPPSAVPSAGASRAECRVSTSGEHEWPAAQDDVPQ